MRAASWVSVSVLLVLGAAATGLYVVRANDRRARVVPVRAVQPERRPVDPTVTATGTIRLRVGSQVRVGAQLSGIVKKLHVTIGSHVRAGDVIAEIDDAQIRARLAQADAQVALDQATLERAGMNAERAAKLGSLNLIPAQQQDDLRYALREAQARYAKSLRDRDAVRVDLGYVQIRSPITGTVASVSTQEGETVAASLAAPTFVTIIADHALELVAMVDETDIAAVRRGSPVSFTVDAYPARSFPGIVSSIAPTATIVSGVVNYEVTIAIRRDAGLLKPDMTANVAIDAARRPAGSRTEGQSEGSGHD